MPPKGGKGKGSGPRTGAPDDDLTQHLVQVAQGRAGVTLALTSELYLTNEYPCKPEARCPAKCKLPNCICAIQQSTRVRNCKEGLWQKKPKELEKLGRDPVELHRTDLTIPAGLNNLGQTCYVNSALQVMYAVVPFRTALFNVDVERLPEDARPVVAHLRQLFAQLHSGARSAADPGPLARQLHLEAGVQQDGQEFFKLLLTKLDSDLAHSPHPVTRSLVPSLFRGSSAYATTCLGCRSRSSTSGRPQEFYEIELNVKGVKTLERSLDDYLREEELSGDNQTMARSKVSEMFRFPSELDLGPRLSHVTAPGGGGGKGGPVRGRAPVAATVGGVEAAAGGGAPPRPYTLAAILFHKGTAATSGHYVAHVKETDGPNWWKYDDEAVEPLGPYPLGKAAADALAKKNAEADAAEAAATASVTKEVGKGKGKGGGKPSKEAKEAKEAKGDEDVTILTPTSPRGAPDPPGTLASSEAYLLLYRAAGEHAEGVMPMPTAVPGSQPPPPQRQPLPPDLADAVNAANVVYRAECDAYAAARAALLKRIDVRRKFVNDVIEHAPAPHGGPAYLVSRASFATWAKSMEPCAVVAGRDVVCVHGAASPDAARATIRLAPTAWDMLDSERETEKPVLRWPDAACERCVRDKAAKQLVIQEQRDAHLAMMVQLKSEEEDQDRTQRSPGAMWVHKATLAEIKKGAPAKSKAPPKGPAELLKCEHGGLRPVGKEAVGKRVAVTLGMWDYLVGAHQRATAAYKVAEAERLQAEAESKEEARRAKEEKEDEEREKKEQEKKAAGREAAEGDDGDVVILDSKDSKDAGKDEGKEDNEEGKAAAGAGSADSPPVSDSDAGAAGPSIPPEDVPLVALPVTTRVCARCESEMAAQFDEASVRAAEVKALKTQLVELIGDRTVELGHHAGGTTGPVYLVPNAWANDLKEMLQGRQSPAAVPGSLGDALSRCRCQVHRRLIVPLPSMTHKRGKWAQQLPTGNMLRVIPPHDWHVLWPKFGGDGRREEDYAIVADLVRAPPKVIDLDALEGGGRSRPSSEPPSPVSPHTKRRRTSANTARGVTPDGADESSPDAKEEWVLADRAGVPCMECRRAYDEQQRLASLLYRDQVLTVLTVKDVAMAEALGAAAAVVESVEPVIAARSSGRSTRTRRGGVSSWQTVMVSSDDTLHTVMLHLFESTGVPPQRLELFYRGVKLGPPELSLNQLGVPERAQLHLVAGEAAEDDELADHIPGDKPKGPAAVERGFAGTGLMYGAGAGAPAAASTGWACATCTFINTEVAAACQVCGAPSPAFTAALQNGASAMEIKGSAIGVLS